MCGFGRGGELSVNEGLGGGAGGRGEFGVDVCGGLAAAWRDVDGLGGGREGDVIAETYKGESRGMWLLEAWLCEVGVGDGELSPNWVGEAGVVQQSGGKTKRLVGGR
jgi:hypothetical protein